MRGAYRFAAIVLVLGLATGLLLAQTTTARVEGTITDPTGAVVSGATVTVTNTGTNHVDTATTSAQGYYTLPALPVGHYRVEVKHSGFSTVTQEITLQVQQVAALNFVLKVGHATESVTVTEDVPLVQSATSDISAVVLGDQIAQLPLNGRNFTQLAMLETGVTRGAANSQATGAGNQSETFRYNTSGGASLSVNGLRAQNNNFLLDGVDNNESLVNTIIFFTPAEAIQEFRVSTSVAPAEFGRAGGGVVNTAIKSGSNSWHGSAFEFLRNDELDAQDFFALTRPEFRRNQFGGTLGGSIIKNKLFVFGDYQGLRQFQPLGIYRATVPTDPMRTGDFSELLNLSTPVVVKDPTTGAQTNYNGQPNVLDPALILSQGTNYLGAFPEPNVSATNPLCALATVGASPVCIQKNYVTQRMNTQNYNDFDLRVDYVLGQHDGVFGRYSYAKDEEITTSPFTNLPAGFGSGTQFGDPKSFVFGETHTFSPNLVNEFRFGWVYTKMGYTPPMQGIPVSANFGIPNANTSSVLGGGALIGGYNNQIEYTGDYGPYIVPEQTWNFSNGLSWIKGKHTVKAGATIIDRQVNLFRPKAGKGFFFLFGDGGGQSPTGYEVSDLLAGFMDNYQVGAAPGFSHTRNWENGYFAQDDWRIARRLTLNLGVRIDQITWPSETNNMQANFLITNYVPCVAGSCPPSAGQIVLPGVNGGSAALIPNHIHASPRIGFAYDVFGDTKTVLRGGFGMFYFLDRGGIDNQLAQNAPFSGLSEFDYAPAGYRFNLAGVAPNGATNPTLATATGMPSKAPLPVCSSSVTTGCVDLANPAGLSLVGYPSTDNNSYAEQWNLQLQRQIGKDMSASLGYLGTRGVHLMTQINYNRQAYDELSGVKPFPALGSVNLNTTIASSFYNSLQAMLQKRLSNGVQFQASYTYSHNIDNSNDSLDKGTDVTDFYYFHTLERANSSLDLRHSFVVSALYQLPFGNGRTYANHMSGIEQALIGGWQINPIVSLQSGMPFDMNSTNQGLQTRPDLVPGVSLAPQPGTFEGWFNPAAFVNPPVLNSIDGTVTATCENITGNNCVFARPGNAPRNLFMGPSHKRMDLAIFKDFKVGERFTTQFRSQFYNLTNTPQFTQPEHDIGNGSFGSIRNTILSSQRQIEFALRVSF